MKYYTIVLVMLFSCSTGKDINNSISETKEIQKLIVQDNYKAAKDNAPFYIIKAQLINTHLTVIVQYTGGCKDHDFQLYTDGNFLKSFPPKINLYLEHNSNNDFCKSILQDSLVFDIQNAKYPGKENNYEVILLLDGFEKEIIYNY